MKNLQITFNNYEHTIAQANITSLPDILQKGHLFFLEAKEYYQQEPEIKETIDLYLNQLNTQLKERKELYGTPTEFIFITRFLKMHKTIQSRDALKNYIFDLQKAITYKEITKESQYAQHIEQIQQKLIVLHNNLILKEKVKIVINRKWRLTLQKIITDNEIEGLGNIPQPEGKSNLSIPVQPSNIGRLFTPINSPMPLSSKNTFKLDGALGELLGDLEKFELAITIEGDQGGGKTRFTYQ